MPLCPSQWEAPRGDQSVRSVLRGLECFVAMVPGDLDFGHVNSLREPGPHCLCGDCPHLGRRPYEKHPPRDCTTSNGRQDQRAVWTDKTHWWQDTFSWECLLPSHVLPSVLQTSQESSPQARGHGHSQGAGPPELSSPSQWT